MHSTAKAPLPATAPSATAAAPKHQRNKNGCDECRRRRIKCDETRPRCAQCAKRGLNACMYRNPPPRAVARPAPIRPALASKPSSAAAVVVADRHHHHEPGVWARVPLAPTVDIGTVAIRLFQTRSALIRQATGSSYTPVSLFALAHADQADASSPLRRMAVAYATMVLARIRCDKALHDHSLAAYTGGLVALRSHLDPRVCAQTTHVLRAVILVFKIDDLLHLPVSSFNVHVRGVELILESLPRCVFQTPDDLKLVSFCRRMITTVYIILQRPLSSPDHPVWDTRITPAETDVETLMDELWIETTALNAAVRAWLGCRDRSAQLAGAADLLRRQQRLLALPDEYHTVVHAMLPPTDVCPAPDLDPTADPAEADFWHRGCVRWFSGAPAVFPHMAVALTKFLLLSLFDDFLTKAIALAPPGIDMAALHPALQACIAEQQDMADFYASCLPFTLGVQHPDPARFPNRMQTVGNEVLCQATAVAFILRGPRISEEQRRWFEHKVEYVMRLLGPFRPGGLSMEKG